MQRKLEVQQILNEMKWDSTGIQVNIEGKTFSSFLLLACLVIIINIRKKNRKRQELCEVEIIA